MNAAHPLPRPPQWLLKGRYCLPWLSVSMGIRLGAPLQREHPQEMHLGTAWAAGTDAGQDGAAASDLGCPRRLALRRAAGGFARVNYGEIAWTLTLEFNFQTAAFLLCWRDLQLRGDPQLQPGWFLLYASRLGIEELF